MDYEDLATVLCDCESVINSRPLTYISEESKDLIAITPGMFLNEQTEYGLPDCDAIDKNLFCRKLKHRQRLQEALRMRFRVEYLGQLKCFNDSKIKKCRSVKVGEVVMTGNDDHKRIGWPLGRVVELMPGKDDVVRLVRLETSRGQLLRPVQRLYPLECEVVEDGIVRQEKVETEEANKENQDIDLSLEDSDIAGVIKSRAPVQYTRSGRVSKPPVRYS